METKECILIAKKLLLINSFSPTVSFCRKTWPLTSSFVCPPLAPCAPESVETSLSCDTNTLEVSWALGGAGLLYNATVSTGGVTALSCTSESSSCMLERLDCGQEYTVTVTAANRYCTGPASASQTIHTGINSVNVCARLQHMCLYTEAR